MTTNYFFTADEHYGHANILKHCDRPFETIEEHDVELIRRHNKVVSKNDIVVHAGDFCWCNNQKDAHLKYISKLNGTHIFLRGSHDHWLPNSAKYIWRKRIENQLVVVCHYAMRTWECSHYNSWHLFGHSHFRLEGIGKSFDDGVDGHNFYPWSWGEIVREMKNRPDNPNFIRKEI